MSRKLYVLFPIIMVFIAVVSGYRQVAVNEMLYGVSASRVEKSAPVQTTALHPYVVAIDPGHGGIDTGAQYIVDEIDVINQTAQNLYNLLDRDENFMPVYTREYDEDPENIKRCEVARNAGAALLISIHANCDSARSTHGFECFPVPPGRATHADSLRFAQIISDIMGTQGHALRGSRVKDGIKYAYYQGKKKIIVESTDTKVRSQRSFGILENSPCPAVLVEQCFITNYNDVVNWASPDGCIHAANVYYTAIRQYFSL